jgi:hypothetical protein
MKPLILTYTGKHVNPLDLRPEDIDIRDIAHALACCNRFAGHCKRPISVAQHSVYVSRLCDDTPHALQALFHDASEAYLGDVTKWLKSTDEFTAYRDAEDRIQTQIYRQFGCPDLMHSFIAEVDKLMLRFEGQQAFGLRAWKVWTEQLPDYPLITPMEEGQIGAWQPWSWRQSEEAFLLRARSLGVSLDSSPRPAEIRARRPGARRSPTGTGEESTEGRRPGNGR